MAETSKKVKLSPRQTKAIEALLAGKSVVDAANDVGVSRQAVFDWLKQTAFIDELQTRQRQAVNGAVRKLGNALDKSVDTVINLSEKAVDENTKLRAALAIPDLLRDLQSHYEFDQRITEVEKKLDKVEKNAKKTG